MPFHTSSASYSTYTSTNTSVNGNDNSKQSGHRYATTSQTDPSGHTTVRSGYQNLGEQPVLEERRFDSRGTEQALPAGGDASMAGGTRRITDLDDEDDGGY
ncbi:hypothetical protein BO71DRAFT_407278 [Aspergillus ellipticus CBS 707.79]|uniref:Uncharacterized protein n=1 Tax=Aspergillus ellipticus CBS 707.79 TaxID=1448320 RepID=A0A319DHX6_9EURO|nr:hypothetical protein BO71DRAFT_407278 [Aspergillus ellipticus CBS 707.79]